MSTVGLECRTCGSELSFCTISCWPVTITPSHDMVDAACCMQFSNRERQTCDSERAWNRETYVEVGQRRTVGVEGRVVVLHERIRDVRGRHGNVLFWLEGNAGLGGSPEIGPR